MPKPVSMREIKSVQSRIARIAKMLDTLAAQLEEKERGESKKRRSEESVIPKLQDAIKEVVAKSDKPVTTKEIQKTTGFGYRQVSNVLYKLTRTGVVKVKSRGLYTIRRRYRA